MFDDDVVIIYLFLQFLYGFLLQVLFETHPETQHDI